MQTIFPQPLQLGGDFLEIINQLATEFHLRKGQVQNTIDLLDDGKTIPFIARYRKEKTGSLDDQLLRQLNDRLQYLRKLQQRKTEICSAIAAQDKLTPELEQQIQAAKTLIEVEDLYLPYRPKRKTRASAAIARGLEPLARILAETEVGNRSGRSCKTICSAGTGCAGWSSCSARSYGYFSGRNGKRCRFTETDAAIYHTQRNAVCSCSG